MRGKITDSITKYRNLSEFQKKIYMKSFSVVAILMLTVVLLFTITAAWYSNIVEVEELVFEVDSWGVDATIQLTDKEIHHAAPGDSKTIAYKVDNNADRLVNIQFNAYKQFLPGFMQQRIYFYLDKQTEVNGEMVDRIYLHDDNAYYYPLMGGQVVDTTGQVISDHPLKWEWVYDLLGYYAIVKTDEEGISKETAYIRPVQYRFESAQYDSATGILTSIKNADGTVVTQEEFILNLLATDGIQTGTQTESEFKPTEFEKAADLLTTLKFKDITGATEEKNYYRIYEDKVNGYGIYMYLCDYNEIAVNNKIDAEIADSKSAYRLTEDHMTIVQLSCGQAMEYFIDVSDASQLTNLLKNEPVTVKDENGNDVTMGAYTHLLKSKNLWDERDYVIIRLTEDMTLNPMLLTDCNMTIDLNGHTITAGALAPVFTMDPGCKLRMYNGTINPVGAVPFTATASTVILKDVMIETTGAAVTIQTLGNPQGSNVQLINCTFKEGRPQESPAVVEMDAAQNVPSYINIRNITVDSEAQEGDLTGEITE